ncbi:hypothetical protein [Streptomyces monashensis]|uniref:Uncharacterized protein n=1 Tax=Streptomyces monashensis TaxID=1678012 RepID=A0A1S2QNU1_9ACTN|nr:hypothetical protein [Streptomyces monashensis]OIK07830.1 hypothetical protein BIV23_02370 [Streptomyces monashensis]
MTDHAAVILLSCALISLIAVLVAVTAGYLARRDHATCAAALTRGAAAFAATLALAATLTGTLAGLLHH